MSSFLSLSPASIASSSASNGSGTKNILPTNIHNEKMRTLFNSLNHDIILRQQSFDPPSPPLTPESPLNSLPPTNPHHPNTAASIPRYSRSLSHTSNRDELPHFAHAHAHYPTPLHDSDRFCKCCTPASHADHTEPSAHRDFFRRKYLSVPSSSYSLEQYQTNDHHQHNQNYYPTTAHPSRLASTEYITRQQSSLDMSTSHLKRKHWEYDTVGEYQQPSPHKQAKLTESDCTNQMTPLTISSTTTKTTNENLKKHKKDTTACQIHGLLSLPGSREPRFNISKTELERRVNEPECLTKVDMISYVRLAKNTARTLLDDNEIKTNQHNKRSEHTVLSRMCESECQVLAQGVNDINFKYFPGSWFVKKSVQEMLMVDDDVATEEDYTTSRQRRKLVRDRIDQDEKTKWILLDILKGLEQRANDKEMEHFNLMSHTFGVPNLINHTHFLFRLLDEESRVLKSYL